MVLVGYSDSEGSDAETRPAPSKPVPKPTGKAAPKLVDPSTSKIKVSLSSLTSRDDSSVEQDARPAKRQRTGGGLNISAFLPPPKNPSKQLANEGTFAAKKAAGRGLGRGVNLKTGAEPAFTRSEASSNLELDGEPKDIKDVIAELRRSRPAPSADAKPASPTTKEELLTPGAEVKLVGNAMRFKPKSVARGPVKKKATAPMAPQAALPVQQPKAASHASMESTTAASASARDPLPKAKARVSLFSIGTAAPAPAPTEFVPEDDLDMAEAPDEAHVTHEHLQTSGFEGAPSATVSSESAISGLNLSEAEMRQLFGRKAGRGQVPDMNSIKMVNFNADAQYAANEEFRAKGESVQHNPVRGIAPGKHSLKQLVNAAATQADALEEHFAQGKRNQKEAGSRYGW